MLAVAGRAPFCPLFLRSAKGTNPRRRARQEHNVGGRGSGSVLRVVPQKDGREYWKCMLTPDQFAEAPVYTLLAEAAKGRIGIDQRWYAAILHRVPATKTKGHLLSS